MGRGITREPSIALLTLAVGWMPVALCHAADEALLELPHRRGELVVDGAAGDWSGPGLEFVLEEPELEPPLANRGTVRVAWDARALWVVFEIQDGEVFAPPQDCPPGALYQYDSVELYLDSRGNRSQVMDQDDFQFVLATDGRYAVYKGDPILATAKAWEVPKSLQASISIQSRAQPTADGYVVECEIPFAAVGWMEPVSGQQMAIDVSWNDWTEDHRPFPLMDFTVDNLVGDREPIYSTSQIDLEGRAYWPWSLSESRDLGHPRQWTAVELVGCPSLAQRLRAWAGGASLGLGLLSLVVLVSGIAMQIHSRSQRRRTRRLLHEIEWRDKSIPPMPALVSSTTTPAVAAPRDDPTLSLVSRVENTLGIDLASVADESLSTAEDLVLRSVGTIRANLREKLSVADLASAVATSPRTLQRAFRERLDCTPGELIVAVKMREARRLLEVDGMRVSQVAYALGFDDPNHFSRRFKSYFRKAPSHFRASAR